MGNYQAPDILGRHKRLMQNVASEGSTQREGQDKIAGSDFEQLELAP